MIQIDEAAFLVSQKNHYLKLRLGEQEIVIPVSQVHTIVPILKLQPIPSQDSALEGSFNYRGMSVLVYHLTELIGAPKIQYDLDSLLLIGSLADDLTGFMVSDKLELIEISKNNIFLPSKYKDMPYVLGLVEYEAWSGWILNLEELLKFHLSKIEEPNGLS